MRIGLPGSKRDFSRSKRQKRTKGGGAAVIYLAGHLYCLVHPLPLPLRTWLMTATDSIREVTHCKGIPELLTSLEEGDGATRRWHSIKFGVGSGSHFKEPQTTPIIILFRLFCRGCLFNSLLIMFAAWFRCSWIFCLEWEPNSGERLKIRVSWMLPFSQES